MKPKGKCFAKNCEDCHWYQSREVTNKLTGVNSMKEVCMFEYWFKGVHEVMGALDGLQNQTIETRKVVEERTDKFVDTLKIIVSKIKFLPKGNQHGPD